MTPAAIAEAVWSALATLNNNPGSLGEKLNDAGSASNPWTETIEGSLTAADLLRLLVAVAAGDATGLNGSSIVFKSLDGTTDRIIATISGGSRTITAVDPA